MIQYTSINEAWGIDTKKEKKEKKEIFKNLNKVKNTPDKTIKNPSLRSCEMFNHIFSCKKCLNKFKEHLNNDNMNEPTTIQKLKTKITEIKEIFDKDMDKNVVILVLIVLIVTILILLINSYKKPVELKANQKGFYIFPEDFEKIRALLELKK